MNILVDINARPVIGHRGNRAHAPENTIESMKQAVALGVDAIEFDVHVSRDGRLVVIHDPTLERTTSGRGAVNQFSVNELQQLDAGANFTKDSGRTFPYRGRGISVPTFDEVAETVRDLPMIIELKTTAATELIRQAVVRHNIAKRVVVASFISKAVHPLRGAGFALGCSSNDAMRLLPRAILGINAKPLQFETVNIPPTWNGLPVPLRKMARSLGAVGVPIHVWTVNDPTEAERYWSYGVRGIISDDPATILGARKSYAAG